MNKSNIISEKVTIIGIVPLDFNATDGSHICGFKIHYYRDKKDSENTIGKVYENAYLSKSDLSDKEKYEKKVYPIQATIEYEFVSLSKKPKPINIIF